MASNVVPFGINHQAALHALVRKRSETDGRIESLRKEIRALQQDIDHIDATIHLFDRTIEITRIRARRTPGRFTAAPGEISRVVIDSLREATWPLTARELALLAMAERGLDISDEVLVSLMSRRMRCLLRYQRSQGAVKDVPAVEGPQGWELVR